MAPDPDLPAADVSVLLATFDGERHLAALLESLLAQTRSDFTILVSDGGSTDATRDILARYAATHAGRFVILPPPARRLGASENFGRLIAAATTAYILLCDQDDVWLPDKVAVTLARMSELERDHGRDVPLMVHTDLAVTDAGLAVIDASFVARSGIVPARNDLVSLLFRNIATGCTIAANRALYLAARPVPPQATMHDHWLAQVAAALGHIGYVDSATILYRQHGGNAVGAPAVGAAALFARVCRVVSGPGVAALLAYSASSAALLARHGDRLSPETRRIVATFADFRTLPVARQIAFAKTTGLTGKGWVRSLGLWILVLRLRLPTGGGERCDRIRIDR